MQHAHPTIQDHVLQAATETCERRWVALWRALEDGTHVSIQRALIAEWVDADDTVKRLVKEKESGRPDNWG